MCAVRNSYYQEVHPDPRTLLENVNLFQDLSCLESRRPVLQMLCKDSKDKQNSDTTQQSAKTLASKVNKGFGRVLAMPSRHRAIASRTVADALPRLVRGNWNASWSTGFQWGSVALRRMLRRSRGGLKRDPAKINALWSMQMMSINEDAAKEAPKDALEEVALDEDAQEYGDGKSETEVRKQKRQVKAGALDSRGSQSKIKFAARPTPGGVHG